MRFLFIAFTLLLPAVAFPQCINYADYVHWESAVELPQTARRLTVVDDRIYVTGGADGLFICDIGNTHSPRLLHTFNTAGSCADVRANALYAFVADGTNGLVVVDVEGTPSLVATLDPGSVSALDIQGDLIAMVGGGVFYTVDVSNPAIPVVLGSVAMSGSTGDLEISGNDVFVGGSYGFRVVDIADPVNPAVIGQLPKLSGSAIGITRLGMSGSFIFAMEPNTGLDAGSVRVIDISDPANPYDILEYSTASYGYSLDVQGNECVISAYWGVEILDITNPAAPVAFHYRREFYFDVKRHGNFIYAVDLGENPINQGRLQIINVSTYQSPPIETEVSVIADDVVVSGNLACVSGWANSVVGGGLSTIDVTFPANPVVLGSVAISGANRLHLQGNLACVTRGATGVSLVDVSVPAAPALNGTANTPGSAIDVVSRGSWAYVADGDSGLAVIDIGNPLSPSYSGSIAIAGTAEGLAIGSDFLFLAAGDAGVHVFDLSNPGAPSLVTTFPTSGYAMDVALAGNLLYVADLSQFLVVDVSSPGSPSLKGSVNVSECGPGIAISETFAYVGDWQENLIVLNVGNPEAPFIIGEHHGISTTSGISLAGGYIYTADFHLSVIPAQCASSSSVPERPGSGGISFISAAHPNPSRGPVMLAYQLPEPGPLNIVITDVTGRLIDRFELNQPQSTGQITWDGRDQRGQPVHDGAYFVRVAWRGTESVRRVVLVR